MNSLGYLANAQPSAYTIPVPPNPYFFASLLTSNIVIATLINLGLLAWALIIIPSNWLATTRILLAMGFDRVLPAKLADVSETYHTPVKSILFVATVTWIGMVATQLLSAASSELELHRRLHTYFGNSRTCMRTVSIYSEAALRTDSHRKVQSCRGIPAITLLGLANFLFFSFISYAAGLNPFIGGPTTPAAIAAAVIVFVGSGALFFIARAYYKKRIGIDIAMNFKEIPPE